MKLRKLPQFLKLLGDITNMDSNTKVIEVEHENQVLGKKLIELYEERIKRLEEENRVLQTKVYQVPVTITPVGNPKPKVRTMTELVKILEDRSAKSIRVTGEEK